MTHHHRPTDAFARKLDPTGSDRVYWDSALPGFGLRLTARGRKRWLVASRSRGRSRRMYFGDPSIVPVKLARMEASARSSPKPKVPVERGARAATNLIEVSPL